MHLGETSSDLFCIHLCQFHHSVQEPGLQHVCNMSATSRQDWLVMSAGVGTASSWLLSGPKWLSLSGASAKLLLSIVKRTNSYVANMGMWHPEFVADPAQIVLQMHSWLEVL